MIKFCENEVKLNCSWRHERKSEEVLPLWYCWKTVVCCVVEPRRWGVVDICDLRPGRTLQKTTTTVSFLLHLNDLECSILYQPPNHV